MATRPSPISKLTGVYHADGGVVGKLRYVVGKMRGTAHCALCDITHNNTGKKQGFSASEVGLGVPLDLVHLDERSPEVRRLTEGKTPCVVAHSERGAEIVLDAAELDTLGGSVRSFERALRSALEARDLSL